MRGSLGRWAVALRIARRSALTSWGRSLLIVALIAVPITGLAGAAVALPSMQSTLAERIQGNLGHAQAKLTVVDDAGRGIEQGAEGGYDYDETRPDGKDVPQIDPRTLLPAGTRTIAVTTGAATFATPKGATSLQVEGGATWDPSLDGGPYVLLSGRRPAATDEVLLSPAALTRLGARVGGSIEAVQPARRTLRVVGTSRDRSLASSAQTVFGASTLLPPTHDVPGLVYVPSTPVDWATVQRLNARAGTTVFSREVLRDPPATPFDQGGGGGLNVATVSVITIALVFAVLEVALLAGSAFLVGARLQQRTLATIASVGADRGVLRRIVTANGVVLGAVGGLVGLALGIAGAIVVMRLTDDGTWSRYPGVHLWWWLLSGIVLFGVVVGWLAALVPARAASRFDVVRALRGARTPQKVGRRPVLGVVLLAAGIACTLLGGVVLVAALDVGGSDATLPQLGALALLGGGPVLAQLGVILCAGLVLRGVARVVGPLSLPARLAARDTSRNLGRGVPAVASVMTTVFVAAFVMCIVNTAATQNALHYMWTLAKPGEAVTDLSDASGRPLTAEAAGRWEDVLRRDLPVRSAAVIGSTPQGSDDATPSDRTRDALPVVRAASVTCPDGSGWDASDTRCGPLSAVGGVENSSQYSFVVGDQDALGLLLGRAPSARATATLQHGGAVALRTGLVRDGRLTVDWFTPKQLANDITSAKPRRTTALPAVDDLPANPVPDALFISTATARSLGVTARPDRVLLDFTRPPTDSELDSASSAVGALTNDPLRDAVHIEQGPQNLGGAIAWFVLLACLVIALSAGATAIGLARVDAKADDATLASLGANARIRKSVAAVQALIVCGLGAVVGTLLGLLPAIALGGATHSFPFDPPVAQLVLTAAGIPVVIAAGAWLLVGTRRADLTRRAAIA